MPLPNVSGSMRTTRSNSSPLASSGVSDETRDVAWNVGSPMTQAIPSPSACAASQVPRIEPSSAAEPWTTGTPGRGEGGGPVGSGAPGRDAGSGSRHALPRRPVVDRQRAQLDRAEAGPFEPFLPRPGEPVPGLGAVPDDREAPGRAAQQQ